MTRHIIRAEVEVKFTPVGMTDLECAYPKIEIEFSYTPGYPEQGPSYDSGGEPGAGAEIDFISATIRDGDGDGLDPSQEQINDWARTWIEDDGYDAACRVAEDEQGPDPDAAYEAMRDDGWQR